MEPEDFLATIRKVGVGLLLASLFVDWGAHQLATWRARMSAFQYRVVPDIGRPGAILADIAVGLLDATSSKPVIAGDHPPRMT